MAVYQPGASYHHHTAHLFPIMLLTSPKECSSLFQLIGRSLLTHGLAFLILCINRLASLLMLSPHPVCKALSLIAPETAWLKSTWWAYPNSSSQHLGHLYMVLMGELANLDGFFSHPDIRLAFASWCCFCIWSKLFLPSCHSFCHSSSSASSWFFFDLGQLTGQLLGEFLQSLDWKQFIPHQGLQRKGQCESIASTRSWKTRLYSQVSGEFFFRFFQKKGIRLLTLQDCQTALWWTPTWNWTWVSDSVCWREGLRFGAFLEGAKFKIWKTKQRFQRSPGLCFLQVTRPHPPGKQGNQHRCTYACVYRVYGPTIPKVVATCLLFLYLRTFWRCFCDCLPDLRALSHSKKPLLWSSLISAGILFLLNS